MANEFKHKSVGSELSQTEYESTDGHVFDSQATGDILYATNSTQLSRLGIGSTGAVLTVTGGVPAWDTTWTPTGHLIPASDDSYDLGSASAAWQDLFLEGDITLTDAGTLATSAGALTITSAAAATWSTSAGALTLNGTGGVVLQEGGAAIISISDARAVTTANTASIALDVTGVIELNSSGGALSIGNDNVDQNVNIATAGTRTLNIGINDGTDLTTITSKGNITNTGTFTIGANDQGYDVIFYGDTASANMTWDTSVDDLILNGAARIVVPDGQLVLGSTAVGSTAAELNVLDGVTAGTVAASKGVVVDANKDIGSFRNLTATGELDAATLDLSSSADIAGDLVLSGGADGALQFTNAGENSIKIPDNQASALIIEEANNAYITFVTTDSSEAITVAKATSFSSNVTVTGNLTVNGTTTTVDTATLAVEDPLIALATGNNAADALDIGFYGLYDTTGSQDEYAGLFRDATDEKWKLFKELTDVPTTTVNTGHGTYAVGTLVATLEGNADTATALATGRTIAMTGDVAWTSASFTGAGNVTGAATIQANAVEGSMLNTNVISGQTEITSGLAAADELLYDDGGVLKKIGLDNFVELTPALATEDAVADGDYILFLDGGASGNMNKEAVHDLATLFAGSGLTATNSVIAVDDAFLINSGNDTTAGTITAAGFTAAADGVVTLANEGKVKFTDTTFSDGNQRSSGITFRFTTSSLAIAIGQAVHLSGTTVILADADVGSQGAMPCIGVAASATTGSGTENIDVLVLGCMRYDTYDFTVGSDVFVTATAGGLDETAPSTDGHYVQKVGIAISADILYVNPSIDVIEHAG